MSQRTVRFAKKALGSPRSLNQEERFVLKSFSRHVQRCQSCSIEETRSSYRCQLCTRGSGYGKDILQYLFYENGRFLSRIDEKLGYGRTEVIVPDEYRVSGIFLQCKAFPASERSSHPPSQKAPQMINVPPITLKPTVLRVQQSARPKELVVHVTVPSFTIPIRLDTESF